MERLTDAIKVKKFDNMVFLREHHGPEDPQWSHEMDQRLMLSVKRNHCDYEEMAKDLGRHKEEVKERFLVIADSLLPHILPFLMSKIG